jgi:hypothetical protein
MKMDTYPLKAQTLDATYLDLNLGKPRRLNKLIT